MSSQILFAADSEEVESMRSRVWMHLGREITRLSDDHWLGQYWIPGTMQLRWERKAGKLNVVLKRSIRGKHYPVYAKWTMTIGGIADLSDDELAIEMRSHLFSFSKLVSEEMKARAPQ